MGPRVYLLWLGLVAASVGGCDDVLFFLEGDEPAGRSPAAGGASRDSGGAPQKAPGRRCADAAGYRAVRELSPHDLRIDAALADPHGADADQEWLQVSVLRATAGDLTGLCLVALPTHGQRRRWCLSSGACQAVEPGAQLTFGLARRASAAPAAATHVWVGRQTLPNGAMTLELYAAGRCICRAALPAAHPGQPAAATALPLDEPG